MDGGWRSAARVMVLVEGLSDAAAVRALARSRGLSESVDGFEVVPMGGVTNVGRFLGATSLNDPSTRVVGLCDAPEERFFIRALQRAGAGVSTRLDMEEVGFFVCVRDLEDELLRSLRPTVVESVLAELGELDKFRTFQRQQAWRGRDVHDQLRRFAGAGSGRKILLAERLAGRLTPATTPDPLAGLLGAIGHRS